MNEHTRIIEINGQKFEVDTRTIKKIDHFRCGLPVKVLIKPAYSNDYTVYPGAIVGIDNFKSLPTIVIAYIPDTLGNTGELKWAYLNANTKDVEIVPMSESDVLPNRETILMMFDRAIALKQSEMDTLNRRKEYFLRQFGTAFGIGQPEIAAATGNADVVPSESGRGHPGEPDSEA